jgi:hypothetical protein
MILINYEATMNAVTRFSLLNLEIEQGALCENSLFYGRPQ